MEYKSEKSDEDKYLEESLNREKKLKKSLTRAEKTISAFSELVQKYNKEKKNGNST